MQNPGKKKITELYEMKTRSRRVRNSNGTEELKKEEFYGARIVKVISGGERFVHYLIDAVFLFVIAFGVGFALAITHIYIARGNGFMGLSYSDGRLEYNFIGSFISLGYYFFFELLTGSTPGKLLLGRTVIDEYGERPEAPTIALRSICRLIPFEAFSCFSERGWHDTLSKTFVVSKKEKEELLELRRAQEIEAVHKMSQDYQATQGGSFTQ